MKYFLALKIILLTMLFLIDGCYSWKKEIPFWEEASELRIYKGGFINANIRTLRQSSYISIKDKSKILTFVHDITDISDFSVDSDQVQFDFLLVLHDNTSYEIQDFELYLNNGKPYVRWRTGDYWFIKKISPNTVEKVLQIHRDFK